MNTTTIISVFTAGIVAVGAVIPSAAAAVTRNVNCAGDVTSALNAAISASTSGDTVSIGAGNCSMSALQMISDKNITIRGAGKDITVITADSGFGHIETTGANSPTWRITGFTLTSAMAPGPIVTVWADQAAQWRGPFRIDHVSFNYPANAGGGAIALYGPIFGLIDHVDFRQGSGVVILTGLGLNTEGGASIGNLRGAYAASTPYKPGSSENLYIEDCLFVGSAPNGIAAIDTGYTGGRFVVRYNTLQNATLYAHWTSRGSVNSLWWEVYGNTFTWTLGGSMYPMRLHGGGTGLIYSNRVSGFPGNYILVGEGRLPGQGPTDAPLLSCDGTRAWDGNAGDPAAPGWPCLSQTGRDAGKTISEILSGSKQASFPLYLWNNGPQEACARPAAGGSPCDNSFHVSTYVASHFKATPHTTSGFGNGDVDYFIGSSKPPGAGSHVLTYAPYTYPHPLASDGVTMAPSTPTNLRVVMPSQ